MTQKIFVKVEGTLPNPDGMPMLTGVNCRVLGRVWDTEAGGYVTDWIELPAKSVVIKADPESVVQAEMVVHPRELTDFVGMVEENEDSPSDR